MGDGSLSQDEIDALLQGADDIITPSAGPAPTPSPAMGGGAGMSPADQSALRDLMNSTAGAVAPSLSGYLGGKNLVIANAVVEMKNSSALAGDFSGQFVQVSMDYNGVLNGKNLIIYKLEDAGAISSLMMGDDTGTPPSDLTEAHQSTIQEFTNQLLSSMATQFGNRLSGGINTTPAVLSVVNSPAEFQFPQGDIVKVTFDIIIDGVLNSKLYHIMDLGISSSLTQGSGASAGMGMGQAQQQGGGQQVGINPVKFPPLDEGMAPGVVGDISLLLDVPMTLTVELGRTTKLVQEILGLGEGSII